MPHLRQRHLLPHIKKMAKLWPIVGVLGPRQSGKTTLLEKLAEIPHRVFLDDFRVRSEAMSSPQTFIDRLEKPVVIDEVQKVPSLFDALKHCVDRNRRPGLFYLTGSSTFSSRVGIRESLTGRIGLTELFPMTLSEREGVLDPPEANFLKYTVPRFKSGLIARRLSAGGMPIPSFLRDVDQQYLYWSTWLDTTIQRDMSQVFRRSYDPDFAMTLLEKMAATMKEGELPSLKHFSQPARKVRTYLSAMEDLFLIRKLNPHEEAIGKECWIFFDAGLASYLMRAEMGEGITKSLLRHFLWNEWLALAEKNGQRLRRIFFKSLRGSPIDLVREGVPYRIVESEADITRRLCVEERPLLGSMKTLKSKFGYLIAPVDEAIPPPKKGGIGILPWGAWS